MSEDLTEAGKRLSYADFLLSRIESNEYAAGAFKHIFSACNIAIKALTNLNQIESESPRLTKQALMKFESEDAKSFAALKANNPMVFRPSFNLFASTFSSLVSGSRIYVALMITSEIIPRRTSSLLSYFHG